MNPRDPDPSGPDESVGSTGDPPATQPPAETPPAAAEQPSPADAPTTIVEVPADINADPPVATETVAVPPVTAATVERADGPRRVSGRIAAIIGIVAVLAIGGIAFLGYSLNQDLGAARSDLATTTGDLESTRTTLESTEGTLATTRADLADKAAEKATLDAEVHELSAQVATQTDCVRLQEEALGELITISELQTANFNRTAENSAWATAEAKRGENITAALDQFYEAYKSAFEGATGTAKTHADRGKAAQSNIAEAEAQQAAELKLVDEKAAEIQAAIDALEQKLVDIETTCEEVAP
ncbi:MAG TPA: hypothetical protein VFV72_12210 [Candidatus Limnocylindrales bacterium]|nr:hypothetical protein [Candidatus Limnocylindrales bacterium]